jgi:hypothetical protein
MIASTVWNQVIETLKVPDLDYLEFVYEGRRYDIIPENLPCLMVEPVRDGEPSRRTNNVDLQLLTIDIFGFTSNNFNDFPSAIVGDHNYKGVLDVAQDLRAVLKSSSTLGDIVYDVLIQPVEYSTIDIEKYPVRGFLQTVQVLYRQTDGV